MPAKKTTKATKATTATKAIAKPQAKVKRLAFDANAVEDALAEPLEDVTGILRLTGDFGKQLHDERTGTHILPRGKARR